MDQSPLLSLNDVSPMKCHHRFPYKPSFIVANSSFRGEITMIFLYFVGCNISFQPRMLGCQIFSDRIPWKCQINPMSHHEIQPYPAPCPVFFGSSEVVNLYHIYQALEEALDANAEHPLVESLHFPAARRERPWCCL